MEEQLLSVGIDIGTSTTQLVIARLTLENRANPFSVPRVAIAGREVLYRSGIHFTPLLSDTVIDGAGVRAIVEEEYRKSGYDKSQVDTGAVIITGETARKENAQEVLSALSEFAGDFVVATAGPDLESILAARGAGVDEYSKEHQCSILHFDIGGGTANLALYVNGELVRTGCVDVGGRLVKIDPGSRAITYVSPVLRRGPAGLIPPQVGQQATPEGLAPTVALMVEALEQAAGLRPGRDKLDALLTQGTSWTPERTDMVSFSGGVADCMERPEEDWLAYGDMGVLLGRAIDASPAFRQAGRYRGTETIRATVVGAGRHTTDLSGSTIFYRDMRFPLKNLPVLKLTQTEEAQTEALAGHIRDKLEWFRDESGLTQPVLALRGLNNPGYAQIQALAQGVAAGLAPLLEAGLLPVVAVQADQAKVLGQALASLLPGALLCLDGVGLENGDYLDIGAPVAGGAVLPVVIKTLVFNKS